MKIVRLDDSNSAPALVLDEAPEPEPSQDEVLIRVRAAAVTPSELLWYPTSHTKSGAKRQGAIPGHEFCGVIQSTGKNVATFCSGQDVFGMNDWFSDGAMAEYCVAPSSAVAVKPERLSYTEAASVPISALTAWQGLLDRARIQAGERVLIHGGAGAVGVFAVQVARLHGAHVVATASPANAEFVRELGAEQVVDYRAEPFEHRVGEIDVVFDTVGGDTLRRSWSVLKPRGRLVTIAASEESATDARTKAAFLLVEANQQQLAAIADLLQTGTLRPVVDTVVTLPEAPAAFAGRTARRGRGKVVVAMTLRQPD